MADGLMTSTTKRPCALPATGNPQPATRNPLVPAALCTLPVIRGRYADAKLEISREPAAASTKRDQSHTIVASNSPWSSKTLKLSPRHLRRVCPLSTSCAYESPTRLAQILASVSCPLFSVCFQLDMHLPAILGLTLFARMLGFFWIYCSRMCCS